MNINREVNSDLWLWIKGFTSVDIFDPEKEK